MLTVNLKADNKQELEFITMEDRVAREFDIVRGRHPADFKWNPRGRVEHSTNRHADPHGATGPTHVRFKYGGHPDTHKMVDAGTIKESNPQLASYPSSIPPCSTVCVTMSESPAQWDFPEISGIRHLQQFILVHWMFSELVDTVTTAFPIGPLVMFISFNGLEQSLGPWIAHGIDNDGILLPLNLNTNEIYALPPPGTPPRVLFGDGVGIIKFERIGVRLQSLAGNPVTFDNGVLTFKGVPTQWEK